MDNDTPSRSTAAKREVAGGAPQTNDATEAGAEDRSGTDSLARGMATLSAAKDAGHRSAAESHEATGPMLPVAEPFHPLSATGSRERTGVFSQLVTDDGDIAGLVAYSIYKQNKLDWLSAFEAARGRQPTEDELASYIIGEGTPRRIATYRHLAEATLAGNGPGVGEGAGPGPRVGFRSSSLLGDKTSLIATYAVIALLFLILFLVAAHYTMSSR